MPRKVETPPIILRWLRENHKSLTLNQMAREVGCCVDTLKRILVREGLQDFDGAKFAPKREAHTKLWERPCMRCKDTTPRARNLYLCDGCRNMQEPYC